MNKVKVFCLNKNEKYDFCTRCNCLLIYTPEEVQYEESLINKNFTEGVINCPMCDDRIVVEMK